MPRPPFPSRAAADKTGQMGRSLRTQRTPPPTPLSRSWSPPVRHCAMTLSTGCCLTMSRSTPSPMSSGTPTWVYSAATMRTRLQVLTAAMTEAGLDTRHPLRGQGQRLPRRARPVRGEGAGAERGQRRRTAERRCMPASPRRRSSTPGVGKIRGRTPPRPRPRHRPDQRRKRRGTGHDLRPWPPPPTRPPRWRCGSIPTSTPAPTTRSPPDEPPTSAASRTPTRWRCTLTQPSCPASSRSASPSISAARSSRSSPYRDAFTPHRRTGPGPARGRPESGHRRPAAAASHPLSQ